MIQAGHITISAGLLPDLRGDLRPRYANNQLSCMFLARTALFALTILYVRMGAAVEPMTVGRR